MRFTPARCHVLVDLVAEDKLRITRNGALEPGISAYDKLDSPFSEKRLLSAVADLYKEGLIEFAEKALYGTYSGEAKLTPWGDSQLIRARDAQKKFAEADRKLNAARAELAERHAEELAALDGDAVTARLTEMAEDFPAYEDFAAKFTSNADPVRARQDEAIQRITVFLGQWSKTANAHPEDIYILQTLDREKDEMVSLTLRVSDLTMLVNAALDAR